MIVMGTADEPSSIDSALRSLSRFYYVVNIPGPLEVLRSYTKITKPIYEEKENDDGFVYLIAAMENFGVSFFPFILLLLTYFNTGFLSQEEFLGYNLRNSCKKSNPESIFKDYKVFIPVLFFTLNPMKP